jgi:aryl-alcohol dehydrogenase-like predicted oxidoreductase
MQQRRLNALDRSIGAIGLGCVGMSAEYRPADLDDDRSLRVLAQAVELGVSFFDTADAYGPFTNERLVGRALADQHGGVVIATKAGMVIDERTGRAGLRGDPEYLRAACDASLHRLGVDVIDLYYLHRVDPAVPIEESWGALADLISAGKVRSIGLCEVTVAELDRAQPIHPVASVQSELSLWTRGPLAEVVPWCETHDAMFAAYAPLGRGYLTGTVRAASFEPADIRAGNPRFTQAAIASNAVILAVINAVAQRHHATLAQVAIAWVLAQGDHLIPIPGTKQPRYLAENCQAGQLELSQADLAELDAVPVADGERY